MTYVMSDLHGNKSKYTEMLININFSEHDTLFILGDVVDRGDESAELYLDIISRSNVVVIKGNHEVMAEEHLEYLISEYSGETPDILTLLSQRDLWNWFENGGDSTVISLFAQTPQNQRRIYQFIRSLAYYKTIEVGGKNYVMVHGGLGDYKEGTKLADIDPKTLVWSQPDFDGTYFGGNNTVLIVGHTPTLLLRKPECEATIYHGKGNVIAIDCGAAYPEYNGRLGCLCLDTGEEFYV